MVELFGRERSRLEIDERTGALAQVAGVELLEYADGPERGVRVLDFRTGAGLGFRVAVDRGFDLLAADYQGVPIGIGGDADMPTDAILSLADTFARRFGGRARASAIPVGHRTRRWAICTGAGASSETLREAESASINTLITGEGPHHTAVEAPERDVVVIYAGHYATETLGVSAVAERIASESGVPWSFVSAPTGL